jgi:hypothetical protein
MQALLRFVTLLLRCVLAFFRNRREQVIVFGERHLRRLLADYVAYYNAERGHTRLGDSPEGRPIETRPSPAASVVGLPRVGGLHHRYVWAKAA